MEGATVSTTEPTPPAVVKKGPKKKRSHHKRAAAAMATPAPTAPKAATSGLDPGAERIRETIIREIKGCERKKAGLEKVLAEVEKLRPTG